MPSSRFKQLKGRLSQLAHMLPAVPAGTTTLTPTQLDNLTAYSILVCAACEHYLEDMCEAVAKSAADYFSKKGKLKRAGRHLLISRSIQKDRYGPFNLFEIENGVLVSWKASVLKKDLKAFEEELSKALESYKATVKDNHGIRSKNVFSLITPIGFKFSEIDPTLASNLGRLSDMRGEAAHRSAVSAKNLILPDSLSKMVIAIETDLAVLDGKLAKFRRT